MALIRRDHVAAEGLLLVEHGGHRDRGAGDQVEQGRDDRGRAEVEGDARSATPVVSPGSTSIRVSSTDDRGHLEVGRCRRRWGRRRRGSSRDRRSRSSIAVQQRRGRDAGPRASARSARRSASGRQGRRITWRPTPTVAAFGRVISGGTSTSWSGVAGSAGQSPAVLQLGGVNAPNTVARDGASPSSDADLATSCRCRGRRRSSSSGDAFQVGCVEQVARPGMRAFSCRSRTFRTTRPRPSWPSVLVHPRRHP